MASILYSGNVTDSPVMAGVARNNDNRRTGGPLSGGGALVVSWHSGVMRPPSLCGPWPPVLLLSPLAGRGPRPPRSASCIHGSP